jgi:hypothetical protein
MLTIVQPFVIESFHDSLYSFGAISIATSARRYRLASNVLLNFQLIDALILLQRFDKIPNTWMFSTDQSMKSPMPTFA